MHTSTASAFDTVTARLDEADLITALHEQLAHAVERLGELRTKPIGADVADEIADIRFFAARLGRRLRALGQDGLLHLSVCASHGIVEVIQAAIDEVREECGRRGIDARIEIEQIPPSLWIDREQLLEALRCALDDAISHGARAITIGVATGRAGRIDVTVRTDGKSHDSEDDVAARASIFKEPAPIREEVVRRLVSMMGGDTVVRHGDAGREMVLALPLGRPPTATTSAMRTERTREGRVYVFPTPSAA